VTDPRDTAPQRLPSPRQFRASTEPDAGQEVTAHSEKEPAAPAFKRGFGFHPLWAFVDQGPEGTGEPLAFGLREGNACSNALVDHIAVLRAALAQLPGEHSRGQKVLVRIDGAGGTHELLAWLTRRQLC